MSALVMVCACAQEGGRTESVIAVPVLAPVLSWAPEPSIVHKSHELLSRSDLLFTVSGVNSRL